MSLEPIAKLAYDCNQGVGIHGMRFSTAFIRVNSFASLSELI